MKYILIVVLLFSSQVRATDFSAPDITITRALPKKSNQTRIESEYQQKLEAQHEQNQELQQEIRYLKSQIESQANFSRQNSQSKPENEKTTTIVPYKENTGNSQSQHSFTKKTSSKRTGNNPATKFQVLTVSDSWVGDSEKLTGIPAGSWVSATLLTGPMVGQSLKYPVLMQLDFAITGPNQAKIPLQGCTVSGEANADLSIERVVIAPKTLSCVRENGQFFNHEIEGFVAGDDSSNGVEGVYSSKQDKVFLFAVLSSIVKGIADGIALKQITEQVVVNDKGSASAKNLTGNEIKYGVATGIGNSASMVTDWYLKHAMSLFPTISVGSGAKVWLVITRPVTNVPSLTTDNEGW